MQYCPKCEEKGDLIELEQEIFVDDDFDPGLDSHVQREETRSICPVCGYEREHESIEDEESDVDIFENFDEEDELNLPDYIHDDIDND